MYFILLGLLVSGAFSQCTLLGGASSTKPSPSLWKCYKYNKEACCVSTHDSTINDAFGNLMSSSCQRKYQSLERYFCIGCSPSEGPPSTDIVAKTLTLCRSFAEAVWGGKLEYPSDSYDACGLNTYWRDNSTTVLQSKEWPNGYAFFNELKPPYFDDYTILITDDDNPCYDLSYWIHFTAAFVFALH